MQKYVDEYFQKCDDNNCPYTITGLALHLGLTRKSLNNYEGRQEFLPVIKAARERVQLSVETILLSGKAQAGSIFWLKNHGWADKQEIEVSDMSKMSREELIERIKKTAGLALVGKNL
ncbi:MAG: hypothetical protein HGA69_00355 [Desulfobulbaceae bacterium]|nr:hypothetical protein [Desulfobulbaceae bacterium]